MENLIILSTKNEINILKRKLAFFFINIQLEYFISNKSIWLFFFVKYWKDWFTLIKLFFYLL